MEKETLKDPDPKTAIRITMIATYCALVNYGEKTSNETMDEILEAKTSGRCVEAAKMMSTFINLNYPHLFESFFILAAGGGGFKNPEWKEHYVFVARDFDKNLYAVSPANHTGSWENTNIFDIVNARSSKELISKLQQKDGGKIWPTADFIQMILDKIDFDSYKTRGLGLYLVRDSKKTHTLHVAELNPIDKHGKTYLHYESRESKLSTLESYSFSRESDDWYILNSYFLSEGHKNKIAFKPEEEPYPEDLLIHVMS